MKKIIIILLLLVFRPIIAQKNLVNLIVGTYTDKCESNGIYAYEFNTQTGEFVLKNSSPKTVSPSFLTVSNDKKFIHAVSENGDESTVSAFRFNDNNKTIKLINSQKAKGSSPCHIINDGRNVITANYSSGDLTVFSTNTDGSISEAIQVLEHKGKSIHPERQKSAHAHMVTFTPDHNYVLANDLGADKIYSYKYNPNSRYEILKINDSVSLKPGSGPRHSVFSKNGKFLYLLQELDGGITSFNYKDGILKLNQETSIIDDGFEGEIGGADIHISPDGKFLYATNRGTANSISLFKVFPSGRILFQESISTMGKKPRNFAIDPTGNFLLVANQDSNEIVVFKRDLKTGILTPTDKKIELCSPVCLIFTE
jgi:6-phosphogluconolactonase